MWLFGPQNPNMRIARVKDGEVRTNYTEHFRDRLQLDHRSASLSLSGLRLNDSGVYMCRSIGSNIVSQQFNLIVYAPVYAPFIRTNSSEMSSSCSSLSVECCVQSSRELRLSWFRGRDKLKETSRPDPSSRLCLSLLIESSDGDEYSCVSENPVDQKSRSFNTEDTCLNHGVPSETLSWCHTEATVRLVLSAVLGLALTVLVADHIRFRRQTRPRC
ncbi:signaling lymphocytic activation molecule-like isoform X2 [Notolabrus celidotus]|nr:signaling lymphocytic activation molecule-like isoform X2 [Notolabrus celidotus]XP_034544215.1 signaling lymphocytic activation molecule-like isoform X2 [Notolabrus celidotus]